MIGTGAAKLRYLVSANSRSLRWVGALLLLIGVVGAAVTMVYPPTTVVTDVTDRSLVETTTTTTATVEGEHAMYDDGEVLTDEPVYVRSVAPNATVTVTTQAPPDGVAVDQQVVIVYAASSTEDGVFRQQEQPLRSTSGTIDREGDTVESVASVRIADVAGTLEAMREEIGDAGNVNAYLRVETTYSSADYDGTLEDRAELDISPDSYRVPPLSVDAEHRTTATSVVPDTDEVVQTTLPTVGPVVIPHVTPVFVVLALLGAALLGGVRYGRREIDADRERVRIHHLRYDEWISRGELPVSLTDQPLVIPMASLEELVDMAIDSNTRVVHDSDQDCYAVLTEGAVFVFYPGPNGGFRFNNVSQD